MLNKILNLKGVSLIAKKEQQSICAGLATPCQIIAAARLERFEEKNGCTEEARLYNKRFDLYVAECEASNW